MYEPVRLPLYTKSAKTPVKIGESKLFQSCSKQFSIVRQKSQFAVNAAQIEDDTTVVMVNMYELLRLPKRKTYKP